MWAMRIVHESELHRGNHGSCFVTLTYRPEDMPDDWSLDKTHFQKFMKRLRKKLEPRKIKFYHAGEYGSVCKHGIDLEENNCPMCNLGRPHYHACLFNYFPDDLEQYSTRKGEPVYTSQELTDIWGKGFVDVGKLEFQSAAYVARYVTKKITGDMAEEHYRSVDLEGNVVQLEPEYATMSNGIGAEWYEKYKGDFFPSDEVPVPGTGVIKKVPRYYEEKLKLEDPEMHEEVKANREKFRMEHQEEYTPERLFSKYKVKKAQVGQLRRNLNE
jgi:hypothetical protein